MKTPLYDRSSYWLFILDIPHLRGNELYSAVKIKLKSLYPANIEDKVIHIRKNSAKKWSYLVFVLDKDTGSVMLPVSPLFIQYMFKAKSASSLFKDKNYIEFIQIENGNIIYSTVKNIDENTTGEDIKTLCAGQTNLNIFCDFKDRTFFTPLLENFKIEFFDINTELKKIDVHKISLFSEKSPVKKRQRFMIGFALLFIIVLGFWMFYQQRQNEYEKEARAKQEQQLRQINAQRTQAENSRLLELTSVYQQIISEKTASPFDIAVIIAECSRAGTRINSVIFNGNFFQIEGVTGNSLEMLHNFENHSLVSSVRLHQVHPSSGSDTFTLSATVKPPITYINEALPVIEQIAFLENFIDYETNFGLPYLTPSDFGKDVLTVFSKWNCSVLSYQFINERHGMEIELSLRASAANFINSLYEIKTTRRFWDIYMTQIKNLFPRNVIEIVIRIRTPVPQSLSNYENTNLFLAPDPYPVANISRHFFPPQPVSRPTVTVNTSPAAVLTPASAQRVNWLEYVGSIRDDNDVRFIYLKDSRTGSILKLGNFTEGDMRYVSGQAGNIIAYINNNIYEITRR